MLTVRCPRCYLLKVNAANAYTWSKGRAIYGSGTAFPNMTLDGKHFEPGQV